MKGIVDEINYDDGECYVCSAHDGEFPLIVISRISVGDTLCNDRISPLCKEHEKQILKAAAMLAKHNREVLG